MTQSDLNKIDRFTERVPPNLADHWIEILDIIENDNYSNQLEMDNFQLFCRLRDNVKYILIMKLWIKEKKINSLRGFENMINFITKDAVKTT